MKKILPLLCFAAIALTLPAADVYVDNLKGDDARDGKSAAQSVRTFAAAMKRVRPGDTLHIAANPEPYYETLVLRGDFGGGGKRLTVRGNGAVISGLVSLDPAKFEKKDHGFFYPMPKTPSNWHVRLFENGKVLPEAKKFADCKPGSFVWMRDGIFFVPAEGKTPADYRLSANLRDSGVQFSGAKNIDIHDLVAERHGNDGFNLHGSCHSILLENVEGRYNGDDGFSAHEDCEVIVRNSSFHHNAYGIEDINISRTFFTGVKVYENACGVHFAGGEHSLVDCEIRDNPDNLRIDAGRLAAYLGDDPAVRLRAHCFVKNTTITGGVLGIRVTRNAAVTLISSLVNPGEVALDLNPDAEAFVLGTVLLGKLPLQLKQARLTGDKNLFHPDALKFNDAAATLETVRKATDSNANSVTQKPTVANGKIAEQPFLQKSPRLRLGPGF